MAKIYGKSGEIIRLLQSEDEELQFGAPPDFDDEIEFDPNTNQQVIDGLNTDWNSHQIVSGELYRNSNPVTINPPGDKWNARLNGDDARVRFLLSQLADKTPEEIYTLMQNRMDGWQNLGQAKADLWEWLPLMAAVIAWKVID